MGEVVWNWTRYVLGLLVMFVGVVAPILYMMLKFNNSTRKYGTKRFDNLGIGSGNSGSSGLKPPLLSPMSLSPAIPPQYTSSSLMMNNSNGSSSSSLVQPIPLTPLQSEKESFD